MVYCSITAIGFGGYRQTIFTTDWESNHMSRTVFCLKLKQELPGLPRPPYPGPLGQKVYEHICAQAWNDWMRHQTMLINEYRLNLLDPQSRAFLEKELEKFCFGDGSATPEGYVPLDDGGK